MKMKLIVGLGNPGKEYIQTRHNIGFMVLDDYLQRNNVKIDQKKFNGEYTIYRMNQESVLFLKPLSYMNLSGEVIEKFIHFYQIKIEDIFIIHDDLDLPIGTFKLKIKGSSGGHNGLKNIEYLLSTQEYKRLKIGISNDKNIDTKDYVLGKFSLDELKKIQLLMDQFEQIIDQFINNISFDKIMNQFNRHGKCEQ